LTFKENYGIIADNNGKPVIMSRENHLDEKGALSPAKSGREAVRYGTRLPKCSDCRYHGVCKEYREDCILEHTLVEPVVYHLNWETGEYYQIEEDENE
jgi:hypothetical protein